MKIWNIYYLIDKGTKKEETNMSKSKYALSIAQFSVSSKM